MTSTHRPALTTALSHCWRCALGALLLLPVASAMAMSYVPMTDEALFDKADVVVRGVILDARGAAGRELDETSYRLQASEVLKGSVDGAELDIRLPGAYDQSARGALIVPGMPRFAAQEQVLLFLDRRADQSYSPSQLLLGVFRERKDVTDQSVLVQDLEQADAIEPSGETHGRGWHRRTEGFVEWVRDRVRGEREHGHYWTDNEIGPGGKFQLSSPPVRWFEFQNGQTVPIYTNESDTGIEDLQDAISAWNNAPGSNISLAYSGVSNKSSGLDIADGINEVLFNDPNNELLGTFDCLLGGLGAYGKWRSLGTRVFNGQSYGVIIEGDIVVQDGISCLFSGRRNANAAELLAHELGHVLGLAHSCGDGLLGICTPGSAADNALMRPTLHADGRGASLASDDIAGASLLYAPVSDGGGGGGTENPQTPDESAGGGALDLETLLLMLLSGIAGWGVYSTAGRIESRSDSHDDPH
ncbi:MAG TPA: matrixin family metalloprotease [Fontimonas sp.]